MVPSSGDCSEVITLNLLCLTGLRLSVEEVALLPAAEEILSLTRRTRKATFSNSTLFYNRTPLLFLHSSLSSDKLPAFQWAVHLFPGKDVRGWVSHKEEAILCVSFMNQWDVILSFFDFQQFLFVSSFICTWFFQPKSWPKLKASPCLNKIS